MSFQKNIHEKFQEKMRNHPFAIVGTTVIATGLSAFFYLRYRVAGPSEYIVRTGLGIRDLSVTKKALQLLLEDAGFEFESQKRFGGKVVDFYVASHDLVFEADGTYWHQDKEYEVSRDKELMGHGIEAVIHLNELDLDSYQVQTCSAN